MRAIVYTEYGPPEVLQLKEVEKPKPKDGELLIKVMAAEATKGDCELRSFNFPVKWFWLPLRIVFGMFKPKRHILGGYLAGEVASVGKNVTKYKPGDKIFGTTGFHMGAYAEYVCLSENHTLAPIPDNTSFEEAATVPLGGLNAIHFMRMAKIKSGEKVLINGAGGSIGVYAVQIAKTKGAEVTAVDHNFKKSMLLDIGADYFIDFTNENFFENGKTYDVIFDMVANKSFAKSVKSLDAEGRYIMGNPYFLDMIRSIITPIITHRKVFFAFAGEKIEELLELKEMIEKKELIPIVDKVYPLSETGDAHKCVEAEQRLGPIVIAIS